MLDSLLDLIVICVLIIISLTVVHFLDLLIICNYRRSKYHISQKTNLLITGGCMGIGRQTALQFAKNHKCRIIVVDIRQDLSEQIIRQLKDLGAQPFFYRCDLSVQKEVEVIVNLILVEHIYIDILINNAGIVSSKLFKDSTLQDYQRVTNINYIAPVQLIQMILPSMTKRRIGHIVNIASVVSIQCGIKVAEYVASKHALWGFHHCLRLELKAENSPISTTIVCPYAINTGMFKGYKTKIDYIMPMLDEIYVGKVIYESIRCKREVVFIHHAYEKLTQIIDLLPRSVGDWIKLLILKQHSSELVGRNQKE